MHRISELTARHQCEIRDAKRNRLDLGAIKSRHRVEMIELNRSIVIERELARIEDQNIHLVGCLVL